MRNSVALFAILLSGPQACAEEIVLYGAGSLKGVLTAISDGYSVETGVTVRTSFGPSGLLREKIEKGDKVDLFASADMGNALKLRDDDQAAGVVMFTRNALCGFASPGIGLTTANFAERLLDPSVKLGTSTPKADPGGDYTWEIFELIEKKHAGALALLDSKAQKIVGGSAAVDSSNPNPIKSAFEKNQINVMIGYCSGAEQQRKDVPGIEVVHIPDQFAAGPEYGLAIMSFNKPAAIGLAFAILSPEGQATLARFGFMPIGAQSKQGN
jgi:molybdate transport system substrate-binding protein